MDVPMHPTRLRRPIESRVRQLVARGPVLAASLVEIAPHCGREGGHGQSGQKHVGPYLTLKVAGKTRTIYVPQELVREVRGGIQEHQRLKQLGQEISQRSLVRIQTHVENRKRRRKS